MNKLLNGLTNATNFTLTENGAITHKTTRSDLLDMFAMGGAMRNRPEEDVILMFRKAFAENPVYALKCLFYLRDVRGGQGERRFFRLCINDLAKSNPEAVKRNLALIPEYGRYDDLYALIGTPVEKDVLEFFKMQLALDVSCKTPSLLAKWLKSENTSSAESRKLANKTRKFLGMTHKEYRKTLSYLRTKINVLEKLMSEGRWDEIEFDKIPSRAGMIYKNAFARHDIERVKSEKAVQTYAEFAKDSTKKVNAKALYPYECVHEVVERAGYNYSGPRIYKGYYKGDETTRLMINKYWDNLTDYFNKSSFDALCMVDTSGSMNGTPIEVAISLGLYCAEKCRGPFAGHYMSFASKPQLIKTEGIDFVDKVVRIWETNLVDNTNIEAAFDLLLETAINNQCSQEDLPKNLIVISDMQFDAARGNSYWETKDSRTPETLMEGIAKKWENAGYEMPHLVYWNVDSRQNNIPMLGQGKISYVSGFSPSIFETLMSGKTGLELMFEKLDSDRYKDIK